MDYQVTTDDGTILAEFTNVGDADRFARSRWDSTTVDIRSSGVFLYYHNHKLIAVDLPGDNK